MFRFLPLCMLLLFAVRNFNKISVLFWIFFCVNLSMTTLRANHIQTFLTCKQCLFAQIVFGLCWCSQPSYSSLKYKNCFSFVHWFGAKLDWRSFATWPLHFRFSVPRWSCSAITAIFFWGKIEKNMLTLVWKYVQIISIRFEFHFQFSMRIS